MTNNLSPMQQGLTLLPTNRWFRSLAALLLGSVAVLGFSPIETPALTMLALVGLFSLWSTAQSTKQASVEGWLFGLGLFGFGVNWLSLSLGVYGGVPLGIAWLMTLVFVGVLALFVAMVGWVVVYFRPDLSFMWWALLFVPSMWVMSEWLRAIIWDGFPWLFVAYSHADTWLAGWSSIAGSLGVSMAVAMSAGLIWWMVRSGNWIAGAFFYAIFWSLSGVLGDIQWVEPKGEATTVALVHGQIPETMKWYQHALPSILEAYRRETESVLNRSKIVIWSETAIPTFLDAVHDELLPLQQKASKTNTTILTGVALREDSIDGRAYFNSIAALDGSVRYDKRHLVPFSEYYPAFSIFSAISGYLGMPMAQFSVGKTDRVQTVQGQRVAMGVCYEGDFLQEMARVSSDADWWLIVSDDGWFHPSFMAAQHWQITKLHARALGREIVRVTNLGVTGVAHISGQGSVLAMPDDAMSAKVTQVQAYQGATPYLRWHDMPLLGVISFVLAMALMRKRRGL